jgi:hypothetical protein
MRQAGNGPLPVATCVGGSCDFLGVRRLCLPERSVCTVACVYRIVHRRKDRVPRDSVSYSCTMKTGLTDIAQSIGFMAAVLPFALPPRYTSSCPSELVPPRQCRQCRQPVPPASAVSQCGQPDTRLLTLHTRSVNRSTLMVDTDTSTSC